MTSKYHSYQKFSAFEKQKLNNGYKRIEEYEEFYLYGKYDREGKLLYKECFSKFDVDGVPPQKKPLRGASWAY